MPSVPSWLTRKKTQRLKEENETLRFEATERRNTEWAANIERDKGARDREEQARKQEQDHQFELSLQQDRYDQRRIQEVAFEESCRMEAERQLDLERQAYLRY